MATSSNIIQKSNFSSSWAQTHTVSNSSKDSVHYLYFCAAAWYVVASATYAAFGGSGVFQMYFSYWNGTSWSSEFHIECGATGGNITLKYGHNRDEGNLSGQPSWFHSNYPLWKLRYWTSRSNSNWNITAYAGGCGLQTVNYPIGNKIYSIGRTGTNVNIHDSGTTEDDTNVLANIFNYSNRTGSPILASCDSELVSYAYL